MTASRAQEWRQIQALLLLQQAHGASGKEGKREEGREAGRQGHTGWMDG